MTKRIRVDLHGYYSKWIILEEVLANIEVALVEKVSFLTSKEHSHDHNFVESEEFPGTCGICGWVKNSDQYESSYCCCEMNFYQHVESLPRSAINNIIDFLEMALKIYTEK